MIAIKKPIERARSSSSTSLTTTIDKDEGIWLPTTLEEYGDSVILVNSSINADGEYVIPGAMPATCEPCALPLSDGL